MTSFESKRLQVCPECSMPTACWTGDIEKSSDYVDGKLFPQRTYSLICDSCRHRWTVTSRLAMHLPKTQA